ncbi:MAG: PGPGW domain-containing protein [Desulfobacteraceae bacterium]|nr:PGPGW domain-containing protein [Desulfobacteraceae bacterium]
MRHIVIRTLKQAKRLTVMVIGFTVLAIGVVMIVLPGPAVVVIPIGLAILATEFIWAKRILMTVQERINRMRKGK